MPELLEYDFLNDEEHSIDNTYLNIESSYINLNEIREDIFKLIEDGKLYIKLNRKVTTYYKNEKHFEYRFLLKNKTVNIK